jgi:hypothetical protein
MRDENKLRSWRNEAEMDISFRYPKVKLGVTPASAFHDGNIRIETFVASKDMKRLTLVSDNFKYTPSVDVFEALEMIKIKFYAQCELTRDKYIYNEDTSIEEPYFMNELKKN